MASVVTFGVRMCSITDNQNGGDGERVARRVLWVLPYSGYISRFTWANELYSPWLLFQICPGIFSMISVPLYPVFVRLNWLICRGDDSILPLAVVNGTRAPVKLPLQWRCQQLRYCVTFTTIQCMASGKPFKIKPSIATLGGKTFTYKLLQQWHSNRIEHYT